VVEDAKEGCKFNRYGRHKFRVTECGRVRMNEEGGPQDVIMTCMNPGCDKVENTVLYHGLTSEFFPGRTS
jgi:hypothetical protein